MSIEIRRLETELLSLKPSTTAAAEVKTTPTVSNATRFTKEINNYGWDQTDKFVKLFVTLPGVQNVPKTNVKIRYNDRGVEILVEDLENKDHKLVIKNLLEAVVEDKSHFKVKTDMVVVFMKKSDEGKKWDFLTKTAKKVDSKANDLADAPMDANPNAALMDIMKKMYESGDANTKQMIEKAYTMNKSSEM